jgi:hypothetical protein
MKKIRMTEEIFWLFRDICKREWLNLARSGKSEKSRNVDCFFHCCPACEISAKAAKRYDEDKDCRYCPVTEWREKAIAFFKEKDFCIDTVCESYGGEHHCWRKQVKQLKKDYAKQIALLEWSWMGCYKNIRINIDDYPILKKKLEENRESADGKG